MSRLYLRGVTGGRSGWIAISWGLVFAVFFILPVIDLYAPGRVLWWHIRERAYVQGGIEVVVLYFLMVFALGRTRFRTAAILCLGLSAFYLRRHHVDLPTLAGLAYVEFLLLIGAWLRHRFMSPKMPDGSLFFYNFLIGTIAWIAVLLIASAVGFGRPVDLAAVTVVCAVVAFAWLRPPLASIRLFRRAWELPRAQRWWTAAFVVWILVLMARSNNTVGFDPLWYGLRPEFVLAPEKSLFDETGLVFPVFYFPKLFELLLLPLSAVPDFSYPIALNVGILGLVGLLVHRLCLDGGARDGLSTAAAAVAMTIPAIANSALTPKPDLIASFFVLLSVWLLFRAFRHRDVNDVLFAASAALLSMQCKLVAIPYVGVLGLSVAVASWWFSRRHARSPSADGAFIDWSASSGLARACCIGAVGLSLVFMWRTWSLTGMPTIGPDPLIQIWTWLGFQFIEPAGTLRWTWPQVWSEVPGVMIDMLFFPSRLSNLVITWIGNIWLSLALFGVYCGWAYRRKFALSVEQSFLFTPLIFCGLLLAFGAKYHSRGGDGNYLIVPLFIAICSAVTCLTQVTERGSTEDRLSLAAMAVSALFHVSFSFANAWWDPPGTRRWDVDLSRSTIDTPERRSAVLAYTGLAEVEQYLHSLPKPLRVVGYVNREVNAFWLSTRFESIETVGYSRPEYIATEAGFLRFLKLAQIDAVIMPIDPTDRPPAYSDAVGSAMRRVKDFQGVKYIVAGRYTVTVLNRSAEMPQ